MTPYKHIAAFSGILAAVLLAGFLWTRGEPAAPSAPPAGNGPATSTPITQNPTSSPIVSPGPDPVPDPIPDPKPTSTPPVTVRPEIVWADRSKQQVVFTFDGGAGNHSMDEILAALQKHGVRSTFFVTGKFAEQNEDAIRRIDAAGHEIFNHTYSHADLTTISDAQIAQEFARTEAIIKNLTGETTKPYFRPPYGARNAHVLREAAEAGYRSIYWTVDALDWKPGITDAEVRARILDNLKPGTIYMMHIGDDITGRILDEIFTEIKARGYGIVSLTQGL